MTEDDLIFLKHVLWQSPEQQVEIGKALARIGNPLNSKAVDYEDQAASVHRECMDAQQAAQSEEQKMQAAIEANTKLKQIGVKLQELREHAAEQGRNANRIDKVIEAVAPSSPAAAVAGAVDQVVHQVAETVCPDHPDVPQVDGRCPAELCSWRAPR